jgi:hypothetical protein
MLRPGLATLTLLAVLGAVAALLSLGVAANMWDWTQRLADRGTRLGQTRQGVLGLLFRGRYPLLLVRILALQAIALALLFPGALSYAIGVQADVLIFAIVAYMLSFLAALVWATAARRTNRTKGTAAPIFGVVMFALFMLLAITLTAFGNLGSFLFGRG